MSREQERIWRKLENNPVMEPYKVRIEKFEVSGQAITEFTIQG